MSGKKGVLSVALGSALLLGGIALSAGTAEARDANCFEKIRREELKLNRDIRRHGVFSGQADHRRNKIRRLRDRCHLESFRHRRDDDWRFDRRDRRERRDGGFFERHRDRRNRNDGFFERHRRDRRDRDEGFFERHRRDRDFERDDDWDDRWRDRR